MKISYSSWLLLTALSIALPTLHAAPTELDTVELDTFAYHAGIEVSDHSAFHQLTLPLEIYQQVQRSDLGDLRVFNAAGEIAPHALLKPEPMATTRVTELEAPMFPVTAATDDATSSSLSIDVRRTSDGTLASIHQEYQAQPVKKPIRGILLDASLANPGITSLRLETVSGAENFIAFTIETSNDLQHWRMLKEDAQLVHLEHDGQRIDSDTVEWPSASDKYLRIVWRNPEHAPLVTKAILRSSQTSLDRAPMIWSQPIAAEKIEPGIYEYPLSGQMPLEQLRINLSQPNSLTPLQIQRFVDGRQRHRGNWQTVQTTTAYRFASPNGDVRSPDIVINELPTDRLRLVFDGRSGGVDRNPPTLQVGFVPDTLVFLARGDEPFTLAWSAASVENSALPIATLMPGYRSDQTLVATAVQLKPITVINAQAAPPSSAVTATPSKGVLWAVLIAGLLVLAGMTRVLLKQMKSAESKSDNEPPAA